MRTGAQTERVEPAAAADGAPQAECREARPRLRTVQRLSTRSLATNWVSRKLQIRPVAEKGGNGVFAVEPIPAGEVVVVWGGTLLTGRDLALLEPALRAFCFQVEDDMFLGTLSKRRDAADYINHSCQPNAGIAGQITLVAMRDIAAGEEICFDYAMTDASPLLEFACQCGAPGCRGVVQADDWRRPDLQARYRGYFSSFLARRIARAAAEAGVAPPDLPLRRDEAWRVIPLPVNGG